MQNMIPQIRECYIKDGYIYRIIYVDDNEVVVTDVEDFNSSEIFIEIDVFNSEVTSQGIRFISEPYQSILIEDKYFKKKQIERRDKRWSLIQPLIYDEIGNFRVEILNSKQRGKIIAQHAEEQKVSKDTIYDSIRLFFKRGMVKNALIPLGFDNIGNKGKRKNHRTTTGRPTRLAKAEGREDIRPLLSDGDIARLRKGYKNHYVDNSHTSLERAYERTLDDEFSDVVIIDGKREIKRWPLERRPTFGQFLYWCHRSRDPRKNSREAKNPKNQRTGKGNGPPNLTQRGRAPGSEVMGDWTHGHRLCSSYDPSIDIGRAIIFFLICVFSRMVVGFQVTFKEDWESIILGVECMAMNKARFGAQFGKEVPEELWPSACMSDRLFYDGGKLDQHNTSGIVAMDVDAQTGIPYAPELRAIMEVLNRKIKQKLKEYLGNTHKEDFDDEKAIARVDRRTYIRIIIEIILEYNQEPIKDYPLTRDMRQKNVQPVPIKLWEYGVANCARPKKIDLDVVRFNLLPSEQASVYRTHIEFRGLKYEYQAEKEDREQFYSKAVLKKRLYFSVEVKYHPGLVDYIYLCADRQLIGVCELAGNDREFLGCSWREVKEQFEKDKLLIDKYQRDRDASQQRADTRARIESDLKRSTEERHRAQQRQQNSASKGREQRTTEANALSKASAPRPEDIGAVTPKNQALSEHTSSSDQDVTMPDTPSKSQPKISPALERLLRANRPRRRRS